MSYGAYIAALEELIQNGETEFESMNALKDRIKEITGKRPGGSFQRNQADYKRPKPNAEFDTNDPSTYELI